MVAQREDLLIIAKLKDEATAAVNKLASSLGGLEKTSGKTSAGTRKLSTDIGFLGSSARSAGAAIAGLVGSASAFGVANFAQGLGKIDVILSEVAIKAGQSSDILERLSDIVRDFSEKYTIDQAALATALREAVSAGLGLQDALVAVNAAARLAVASNADLGSSLNLILTTTNAYGLGVEALDYASEKLFATAEAGRATITDLAGSFGDIATLASQLGVSISDLGASIATITKAGNSGQEAVSAISQAFALFIQGNEELPGVLDESALRVHGLRGALVQLRAALESQGRSLSEFFPRGKTLNAILKLSEQGSEDFARAQLEIAEASDDLGRTVSVKLNRPLTVVNRTLAEASRWFADLYENARDARSTYSFTADGLEGVAEAAERLARTDDELVSKTRELLRERAQLAKEEKSIKEAFEELTKLRDSVAPVQGPTIDEQIQNILDAVSTFATSADVAKFQEIIRQIRNAIAGKEIDTKRKSLGEIREGLLSGIDFTFAEQRKSVENQFHELDAAIAAVAASDKQLGRETKELAKRLMEQELAAIDAAEAAEKLAAEQEALAEIQRQNAQLFESLDAVAGNLTGSFVAFATGAQTAREAFRNFAVSVIGDLLAIQARALILRGIGAALSAFNPSIGGAFAAGQGFAQGGVVQSITAAARGTVIPPGPHLVSVNEGPPFREAVLPLTSTSQGLGVRAVVPEGGGGNVSFQVSIFAVDSASFVAMAARDPKALAEVVVAGMRSNPTLRNAMTSRGVFQ